MLSNNPILWGFGSCTVSLVGLETSVTLQHPVCFASIIHARKFISCAEIIREGFSGFVEVLLVTLDLLLNGEVYKTSFCFCR